MDFRELVYMTTIADQGSITKAARRLYISQPALSHIVSKVEEEMDVKLFDRKSNPITLTYAGEKYISTARQILKLRDNLRRELRDIGHGEKGEIRLGIPTERAGYMLPRVAGKFRELFPGIQIRLSESKSDDIIRDLEKDKLSLAILPGEETDFPAGLKCERIYRERILLVAAAGMVEAELGLSCERDMAIDGQGSGFHSGSEGPDEPTCPAGGSPCQNSELQKTTLIDGMGADAVRKSSYEGVLTRSEDIPVADIKKLRRLPFIIMRRGQYIRKKTDVIMRKAGFFPKEAMEVSSCLSAAELAKAGLGITIVPERVLMAMRSMKELSVFHAGEESAWDVNVIYKEDVYLDRAERYLIELMQQEFGGEE